MSAGDGILYKPVGFFWNMDTCPAPEQKSVADIIAYLRKVFVQSRYCHKEYEFIISCDVTKLREDVGYDINRAGIILAHVRADSRRNSADKTLCENVTKFIANYRPQSPQWLPLVVYISGDTDIGPVLRSYQQDVKCMVAHLHPADSSEKLSIGWCESYQIEELCAAVPSRLELNPSAVGVRSPDLDGDAMEVNQELVKSKVEQSDEWEPESRSLEAEVETSEDEEEPREADQAELPVFATDTEEFEESDVDKEPPSTPAKGKNKKKKAVYVFICAHPSCSRKGSTRRKKFKSYMTCLQHVNETHRRASEKFRRPEWTPVTFVKTYLILGKRSRRRFCCAYPTCFGDRTEKQKVTREWSNMCQFKSQADFLSHFRKHISYKGDPNVFLFLIPTPSRNVDLIKWDGAQASVSRPIPLQMQYLHVYICVHPTCGALRQSCGRKPFKAQSYCVSHIIQGHLHTPKRAIPSAMRIKWSRPLQCPFVKEDDSGPHKLYSCVFPSLQYRSDHETISAQANCYFKTEEDYRVHFEEHHSADRANRFLLVLPSGVN